MGLFSRRRRQHADYVQAAVSSVSDSRQGVVDYAGAMQQHAVGWTDRAWTAYQGQITDAAISYVAGTSGVSGEEVAGMILPDVINPDASQAAGDAPSADLMAQVYYDKLGDQGLVNSDYQQYVDHYWASNNEFGDELGEGWREAGASWSADQIGSAISDDEDSDQPPETQQDSGKVETDIPPPQQNDPMGDDDEWAAGKTRSIALLAAAGLAIMVLR